MVEYILESSSLDSIFGSLADPTRRDILKRLEAHELSVSDIAFEYDMSMAAVSKHLKVLEKAKLITKEKEGKKRLVRLTPDTLKSADEYLEQYRQMWQSRFNKLDSLINERE